MKSIRSVNICWEKRFRGSYPASRFSLSDSGSLAIAVPRPLESRTYDITKIALDGSVEVGGSFSVETLVRLEVISSGATAIGMTADDLYLFTEGMKNKFLAERRLSYIDAMVNESGGRVAAGFSDLNGTSFALAYGELTGKASWTRDVNTPLTALAISRDGSRITIGTELGMMWQIDAARRDIWEFEQREPIRALASSLDGSKVVYGTASGSVGCLDAEGARLWETHLPSEIVQIVVSGDGTICAAYSPPSGESPGRLTCISGLGNIGWECEPEKTLKGLSLSSNGKYLASGTRDGLQAVFEIVMGEGLSIESNSKAAVFVALEHSRQMEQAGDTERALNILLQALLTNATSSELAREAGVLRQRRMETAFLEAQELVDLADFASAWDTLSRLRMSDPTNPVVVQKLHDIVILGTAAMLATAKQLKLDGSLEAAESGLNLTIEWDQFVTEPRDLLGAIRSRRSQLELEKAHKFIESGNYKDAIAAYERASALEGLPEIIASLEKAKTQMDFDLGMEHYNQKRYREAIFQFKKVLLRDPTHTESERHLGYAQKFAQDISAESINDRFSRLEQ